MEINSASDASATKDRRGKRRAASMEESRPVQRSRSTYDADFVTDGDVRAPIFVCLAFYTEF